MGFSRQEYWSGLPFPSPGVLPDLGIEPFPALQADSLSSEPPGKPPGADIRLKDRMTPKPGRGFFSSCWSLWAPLSGPFPAVALVSGRSGQWGGVTSQVTLFAHLQLGLFLELQNQGGFTG